MKARWLYCSTDETWHIWDKTEPEDGDQALCGHVKDENCTVQGDGVEKCQTCVRTPRSP